METLTLCLQWMGHVIHKSSKNILEENVSIETLLILNHILGFKKQWDDNLTDPVWESVSMKMKKYSPFLNIDVPKYKIILKKVVLGDK